MAGHTFNLSAHRIFLTLAIILAAASALFLVLGADMGDDAAFLAAVGLIASSAAIYVAALMPRPQRQGNDLFENVAWGKAFVAATYASIALAALVAMTQVQGYARLVHLVHTLLLIP